MKLIYYTCLTPTKKSFARGSYDKNKKIQSSWLYEKFEHTMKVKVLKVSGEIAMIKAPNRDTCYVFTCFLDCQ